MRCPHCGAPYRASRGRCLTCGGRINPVDALPPGFALVIRSGTPLRDRAGSPAAVVQTLSRGETVEMLRRDGSFAEVRTESGQTGFVDTVNLGIPGTTDSLTASAGPEPEQQPSGPGNAGSPRTDDLPHGMIAAPGERVVYQGDFLYDPFGDRVLAVTTHRVLIGGGGTTLPRVLNLADIISVGLREGSSGMALGERTVVIRASTIDGEIYVAGLRDPQRAVSSIRSARAEAQPQAE